MKSARPRAKNTTAQTAISHLTRTRILSKMNANAATFTLNRNQKRNAKQRLGREIKFGWKLSYTSHRCLFFLYFFQLEEMLNFYFYFFDSIFFSFSHCSLLRACGGAIYLSLLVSIHNILLDSQYMSNIFAKREILSLHSSNSTVFCLICSCKYQIFFNTSPF